MKRCGNITRKDVLVVLACAAFLLLTVGSIGRSGREQARRTICANNLKQLGTLLDLYCADYKGYYPPAYSGNYMNCAISYDPFVPGRPGLGLLGVLPYLVDPDRTIYNTMTSHYNYYSVLKTRDNVKDLKFFWCPSGNCQYDPIHWQQSVFASFGYAQYCSRYNLFNTMIGGERRPQNRYPEHSPLKNIPHINADGQKSNATWITFTDISTNGQPIEPLKSNHFRTDTRFNPMGPDTKCMGCAGSNALHVGGNVTWYGPKVMDFTSSKCFMIYMRKGLIAYDDWSWWMFPRTP